MDINKYLITEKVSQSKLKSMFKFLPDTMRQKLTMDIWHYVDTSTGEKVVSGQKTFTDELITRLNLDDYQDLIFDMPEKEAKGIEKKLLKAVKSLNLDSQWDYDKKMRAFIKK